MYLRVLFLQEQVSDLRVQEFLRELMVGVAAPSDFVGSILLKIFHSVKGEDVEQVCLYVETTLPCLRLLISLSLEFISCMLLLFTSFTCLIFLYASYIYLLGIV